MNTTHPAEGDGSSAMATNDKEEGWDLRHVYSADEIRACAAECMGKDGGCGNVACSRYVNTLDEHDVWDTCIDCQEE